MLTRILILVAANLIGFFAAPLCYVIGLHTGTIPLGAEDFDVEALRLWFFTGIMMTWIACALFSPLALILNGPLRLVFAAAPAVMPIAYGLYVVAFVV